MSTNGGKGNEHPEPSCRVLGRAGRRPSAPVVAGGSDRPGGGRGPTLAAAEERGGPLFDRRRRAVCHTGGLRCHTVAAGQRRGGSGSCPAGDPGLAACGGSL